MQSKRFLKMLIEKLKAIVGSGAWKSDTVDLQPYVTDWHGRVTGSTPLMVAPANTGEVAQIVRACSEAGVAIVPQGGNTGMCAAAVPDESGTQIILSLSRMNKIRHVDPDNFSMEVEAGCILAAIQDVA